MSATSSYELSITVTAGNAKDILAAKCSWEDNEWDGGALERRGVREALNTAGSGPALMRIIENAYYNSPDLNAPLSDKRPDRVNWSGSEALEAMDDFSNVCGIVLTEITYSNSTGDSSRRTLRLTAKNNKNLASLPPEKPAEDNRQKETVRVSTPYGSIRAERYVTDGDGKRSYGNTCDEIIFVLGKATKIEASPEAFKYALESMDEGTKRTIAYRFLTGKVEITGGKLDAVIKKHREKLLSMFIADGNADAVKTVLGMSRKLKPINYDELIGQANKRGNQEIVSALRAEKDMH